VSFVLTRLVPGDPVTALIGEYPVPDAYIAEMRSRFGLDLPQWQQLLLYLGHLLRGDLGFSFANQQPVLNLLLERSGNTLLLMLPALALSSLLGILVAVVAARWPGGTVDHGLTTIVLAVDAIPVFWLGQMAIIVFAVHLHLLPAQGMLSMRLPMGASVAWDFFLHWIMPGLVITLAYGVVVARVARASIAEMSEQDFVVTAKSKGLTDREILWHHILPNAMIPVVSVIGYNFGHALTGAIMTEAVFAWPGLGGLFVSAITNRDYPVLQGIFLLTAVTVVLANLVTDVVYSLIDPRVRHGLR
jgi:peptide/nickel transport system permease protein